MNSSLKRAAHDTTRVYILNLIAVEYHLSEPDTAMAVFERSRSIISLNQNKYGKNSKEYRAFHLRLAEIYTNSSIIVKNKGNYPAALELLKKGLAISEALHDKYGCACSFSELAGVYDEMGAVVKAVEFFEKSMKLREEIGDKEGISQCLNNLGAMEMTRGNIDKGLSFIERSFEIRKEMGDKKGMAAALLNMGSIHSFKGNIQKAIEYSGQALKLNEEMNNKFGVAGCLNNLAEIYKNQGDLDKSLEYHLSGLKIREELKDKKGVAESYNNIGRIHRSKGEFDKAMENYIKSMKIREEIGDIKGIAQSNNNIAIVLKSKGDLKGAEAYYKKNLLVWEQVEDMDGIILTCLNLANNLMNQKKYSEAIRFANEGLKKNEKFGVPAHTKNGCHTLFLIYKITGDHKRALENYELHIKMRDSINNESTRKASIKSQLKYEYEKQAAADSVAHAKENEIKSAELSRQAAEIKAKKNQQYALFGGLALVIIFEGFMYNRFKITQKQKSIIEHQKEVVEEQKRLVEEKQKEILDSIHYAKRIQMAQVPSEKRVIAILKKIKGD